MAIQIYDSGIETGTKYLTVEVAYFLGGIYAADENVMSNGKLYWHQLDIIHSTHRKVKRQIILIMLKKSLQK